MSCFDVCNVLVCDMATLPRPGVCDVLVCDVCDVPLSSGATLPRLNVCFRSSLFLGKLLTSLLTQGDKCLLIFAVGDVTVSLLVSEALSELQHPVFVHF